MGFDLADRDIGMIHARYLKQLGIVIACSMVCPQWSSAASTSAATSSNTTDNAFYMPSYQSNNDTGLPSLTNIPSQLDRTEANTTSRSQMTGVASAVTAPLLRINNPSAYALYVAGVTGDKLTTFGSDFFNNNPSTFSPLSQGQVNGDYVLGPGDELQIRGWGMVDIDLTVNVDRQGTVYLPRVGSIKVAGVRYRDLQAYLKKEVNRVFTNFDLTVSVGQTRALQVYVVGNVSRPGTYTLNSMSTVLNALFFSGGPSAIGSMRDVQVKRGGSVLTHFDLYDVLVNGDKSKDMSLQDGDVIFVPPVGSQIAITGNVKNAALFELKPGETLADAIRWSGNFDSAAEQRQIIVEKSVDNRFEPVVDVQGSNDDVLRKLMAYPLTPGMVFRVFSPSSIAIAARIQREFVTVSGEVAKPGVVEIKKGETLRELVARLGGATDTGYVYGTKLTRLSVQRDQQKSLDDIADKFESEANAAATQRLSSLTDTSSIAAVQGQLAKELDVAKKLRSVKADGRIVLELKDVSAGIKNLPDVPLEDGDKITIPRLPSTVDVLGAVNQQSAYIYKPERSVKDYLTMAGGPSRAGDIEAVYVVRADGTISGQQTGWLAPNLMSANINPGDTVVVPQKVELNSWVQSLKEWTAILYQFGLGAAGLKVLK